MLNNGEVNPSDEIRGKRDAKDGKPAESGASDSYNRGYGSEYEAQEVLTYFGLMHDNKMSIFG